MSFKIPKKKREGEEPETDSVVMQSPLSRLQDSTVAMNGWRVANGARGRPNGENRVNAGKGLTFRDATQRSCPGKLPLRSVVRNLLRIDEHTPARETPSSTRTPDGHGWSGQPAGASRTQQAASNGWRPRRASDRLLPSVSAPLTEEDSQRRKDSVVSVDSSDTPERTSDRTRDTRGQSLGASRDPFSWPSSSSPESSPPSSPPPSACTSSSHPVLSTSLVPRKTSITAGRLSLTARRTQRDATGDTSTFTRLGRGRPHAAPPEPIVLSSEEEEDMEDIKTSDAQEASRRVQDSAAAAEACSEASRTARTCPEDSRAARTCSEAPMRAETSSEGPWTVEETSPAPRTCPDTSSRTAETETTSEGSRTAETSSVTSRTAVETTSFESSRTVEVSASSGGSRIVLDDVPPPPPPPPAASVGDSSSSSSSSSSSTMELQFSRLLLGQLSARAEGTLLITEPCIFLPLKGLHSDSSEVEAECLSVAVATSQLRGYGVWEEGVAACGHALLFLWVTDSQARLLQTELSVLQPVTAADGACPFILVELTPPPAVLQLALLRSLLDVCGAAASRPASVSVSHALSLMHKHPPMLALLEHNATGVSSRLRSRAATCLTTTRLIQYPLAQGKGRIAVTTEDLSCLNEGEFLNDVIIDFYLKYLLLECSGNLSERCHVFSSFFYRQLTKRRTTEEEPGALDRVSRHQRVKTWTRNVDIFDKDFLFVPVNQESHWYLIVVCFPGLVEDQLEETNPSCASTSTPRDEEQEVKRPRLNRDMRPRGPPPIRSRGPSPECTMLGWKKETALKRPCILVMDSLTRSKCHENVCRLIREYMHVEWTERRRSTRLFSSRTMRSSGCRLPTQDNSSDCGLYLLQYVETFLKNPVVHFDLPVCLNNWFPRQQVRRKREDIRQLVMDMHRRQTAADQPL